MTKRNLDGVYFRVMRDGKGVNVCWTDLDWEDRVDVMMRNNHEDWLLRMVQIMNGVAEDINEAFPRACVAPVTFPMDRQLTMAWLRTSLMRLTADIILAAEENDIKRVEA